MKEPLLCCWLLLPLFSCWDSGLMRSRWFVLLSEFLLLSQRMWCLFSGRILYPYPLWYHDMMKCQKGSPCLPSSHACAGHFRYVTLCSDGAVLQGSPWFLLLTSTFSTKGSSSCLALFWRLLAEFSGPPHTTPHFPEHFHECQLPASPSEKWRLTQCQLRISCVVLLESLSLRSCRPDWMTLAGNKPNASP